MVQVPQCLGWSKLSVYIICIELPHNFVVGCIKIANHSYHMLLEKVNKNVENYPNELVSWEIANNNVVNK